MAARGSNAADVAADDDFLSDLESRARAASRANCSRSTPSPRTSGRLRINVKQNRFRGSGFEIRSNAKPRTPNPEPATRTERTLNPARLNPNPVLMPSLVFRKGLD